MNKKKKGKWLKIIGIIVVAVAVIIVGMITYLTRGLNQMMELVIAEVNLAEIPDGTYRGSFEGYRWSNTVEVTIADQTITRIEVIDPPRFDREGMVDDLIPRIIDQQSLQVDTVTQATVSSKAFLKAVEDALTLD